MPCSACGKKLALASNRPVVRSTTFRMGFSDLAPHFATIVF